MIFPFSIMLPMGFSKKNFTLTKKTPIWGYCRIFFHYIFAALIKIIINKKIIIKK